MSSIVWFKQSNLPEQLQHALADAVPGFNYRMYQNVMQLCYGTSFFSRTQQPGTPFVIDRDHWHAKFPQSVTSLNFDHITDQRCHWLKTHRWDRPWLIEWSGGLDSTLVLCSILINLSKQDLEHVTVGMTPTSIYENPRFFHDCIKDKLQIKDITASDYQDMYKTHYLITGEPADMLTGGALAMHACSRGIDLTLPWRSNRHIMKDFLASTSAGRDGTEWLLDTMARDLEGCQGSSPPVNNILEWFSWINLNWKWIAKKIYKFQPGLHDPDKYFHSLINWFDTDDYQNWSIHHGRYSLITDGTSLNSYKKDFRQYIMKIFRDRYYDHFKIKIGSTSSSVSHAYPWACLLDDGSVLTAENDMDEIISLFSKNINT